MMQLLMRLKWGYKLLFTLTSLWVAYFALTQLGNMPETPPNGGDLVAILVVAFLVLPGIQSLLPEIVLARDVFRRWKWGHQVILLIIFFFCFLCSTTQVFGEKEYSFLFLVLWLSSLMMSLIFIINLKELIKIKKS